MCVDDPVHQVRFHLAKKESGFDRLISLDTFNVATNGYLVNDSCIFGVEVFVVKYTGIGETLKILKMNIADPSEFTGNWNIREFSELCKKNPNGGIVYSSQFAAGQYKWRILFYPNGDSVNKDCLSIFLELVEGPSTGKKVLAEFSLGMQNQISKTYHEVRACMWFNNTKSNGDATSSNIWGWSRFMLLSDLQKESRDTIPLQVKINIKAEVTIFS